MKKGITLITPTGGRPLVFKMNSTNIADVKTALYAQMKELAITEMVGGLDKRTFVSLSGVTAQEIIDFTGSASEDKENWMEFLGFSRIDGLPMFRIFRQAVERGAYNTYDTTKNTFPFDNVSVVAKLEGATLTTLASYTGLTTTDTVLTGVTIELVSLMEDHTKVYF